MDEGRFVTSNRRAHGAHVYRFNGAQWEEEAVLPGSSPWETDIKQVAIHGDVIALGEPLAEQVTVFELSEGGWVQTDLLTDPTPNADDWFGYSIAIEDDLIVVGEPISCDGRPGEIFFFERVGPGPGGWTLVQKTKASDANNLGCGDQFGYDVALLGDRLLVGAPVAWLEGSWTGKRSGAAYLFERTDNGWVETTRLEASGQQASDGIGWSVGLSTSFAIVGAPAASGGFGLDSGEAYAYQLPISSPSCSSTPTSTGKVASLQATGSKIANYEDLELFAKDLPHHSWGHFLASPTQDWVIPPGAQGPLCLGAPVARLSTVPYNTAASGFFRHQVETLSIPFDTPYAIQPGETWYFQAWFRDNDPSPTIGFSDAVSIQFE